MYLPVEVKWSTSTFIFYMGVILICYLISIALRKIVVEYPVLEKKKYISLGILVPFLLLVFVKGFITFGRDLVVGYYLNFLSAENLSEFRDKSTEIGYRILNVVVHNIYNEYWFFLLVMTIMTLAPIFYLINKYRNNIDVPVAVLMYCSIFFFPSFSVFRIYIASSICLLALDAMYENKNLKALFFICLAISFHTSSAIMLIFYLIVLFKINLKILIMTFTAVFLLVFTQVDKISFLFSGRYSLYQGSEQTGLGFQQLLYYLPILFLILVTRKYVGNEKINKLSLQYVVLGFFFGMMGYVVSIFGRFQGIFEGLILIVSYYTFKLKGKNKSFRLVVDILVLVYCIIRFVFYISEYYDLDDMMPYTNIFGWVFD